MKNDQASYKIFFGLQKEPFGQNVRVDEMMKTTGLMGVKQRFLYAVGLSAVAVITGDVGSGKSSGLRFAQAELHPSEYKVLHITATSGTIAELYKQICHALDIGTRGSSKAVLTRTIRACLLDLVAKKQKPVLVIDEASLLRLDVFTELHTITQFEADSKPVLPIILAEWIKEKLDAANKMLDNYRQILIQAGFPEGKVRYRACIGESRSFADAILETRCDLTCCTVVVGRSHKSRTEEFLFGSTSSRLIHEAQNCAVWVVE